MKKDTHFAATRRAVLAGSAATLAAPFITRFARAQDPVNVGVILPLSGANAQFGINSRNGIQLVADEINAAGGIKSLGGAPINLVIADATSTPSTAASAAQRMISRQDVVSVLGAFASSLTIAISEVTERRGLPLLTMSFSDTITGRGFKNVFQVVNKASTIGEAQFDYTVDIAKRVDRPADKVAIMYEDTAYGTSQAEGLRKAANRRGSEIVMDAAYPLGITDVTPLINQLRASGAELVFPVSYLNDSLQIVRSMRQQGLTMPAVGGAAGYVIPDFRDGLGELANGVMSISPANYDLAPSYTERFHERYGYFMVHEALEHAVCLGVLREALEASGTRDPEGIRQAIASGTHNEDWSSVMTGDGVRFDETGLNENAFPVMVQWREGELVTIHPAKVAQAEPVWSVDKI